MDFTRGEICCIVGENGRPVKMKVVGRGGTEFLLQDVGKSGTLLQKASEMFRSLEEALKWDKLRMATCHPFIIENFKKFDR